MTTTTYANTTRTVEERKTDIRPRPRRRLKPEHHLAIMFGIVTAGLILSTMFPMWNVSVPWTVPVIAVVLATAFFLDTHYRDWFRGRKR